MVEAGHSRSCSSLSGCDLCTLPTRLSKQSTLGLALRKSPLRKRLVNCWEINKCHKLINSLSVLPKVKMLISFFQLAIAMPSVYEVTMPRQYREWMRIVTSWLDIEVRSGPLALHPPLLSGSRVLTCSLLFPLARRLSPPSQCIAPHVPDCFTLR